jgi:radical SAM superfamily enzyme YgiQ (UPF0313 family)
VHYEGIIIRPPSEANAILLQVAVGCSHNRCTFCGTYKEVTHRIKDAADLASDLQFAATHCRKLQRVFLTDGDVLRLPFHRLADIFQRIACALPWVNRISLYGSAISINNKTDQELLALKRLGLDRVYMGLESGHDQTLAAIHKGADAAKMVAAGHKVRGAGLFLSVTVLLGIAGVTLSAEHAAATGEVLTAMAPNQIGVLTLMLLENTPLFQEQAAGRFHLPDAIGLLTELRGLVQHIGLKKVQFQANHASNYLPINCRLERDKTALLHTLDQAITGQVALRPETMRAL